MENTALKLSMIIILTGSPFITAAVHMLATRVFCNSTQQIIAIRSVMISYLPVALLLWKYSFQQYAPASLFWTSAGYCLIVHTALAYTYFHFFNMSETARRIRLLYEIYHSGSLTAETINRLYRTSDVIHLRLKRLVDLKQLVFRGGYYTINDRTLYRAARIVFFWRRVLGF